MLARLARLARLAPVAAAAAALAGCAAPTDAPEGDPTSQTAEALSTKKALLGTWDADTGAIYGLELTSDYAETLGGFLKGHRFEAKVDNGIRCFTVPCPSTDELSGVYAVKGNTITFAPFDRPIASFAKIAGTHHFHVTGKTLSLDACEGAGTTASQFHRAEVTPTAATCGDVVCGEGTVCCNPLSSTCVKPGMMCAL